MEMNETELHNTSGIYTAPQFQLVTAPLPPCLEPHSDKYTTLTATALAAVIAVVAIATIAGNTLVVIAFATDRKLRSFGNYFILNLAISDLIVGLLICIYAPYLLRGCWQLTRIGCLAFLLLDYVVPLASAWNMALISLDRYCSVARPVAYRRITGTGSRRRAAALGLMSVPWLVGATWYGPTVLFWPQLSGNRQRQKDSGETICQVDFYDHVGYLVTSSCVEFLSPFITVATINVLIYVNIRRRSRGLTSAAASSSITSSSTAAGGGSASSRRQLLRDKRSARSLAVLVIVFLVTWGPFEVCAFVNPVCGFCIPDPVSDVAFWLLWINSTVNPALYPFLQQRFRIAFVAILRCQTTAALRHQRLSATVTAASRDPGRPRTRACTAVADSMAAAEFAEMKPTRSGAPSADIV
jgi:hypothetical protein